ncbi:hypothetical protein BGX31_003032 [Mortierella sp. GBA43]|nr:hypothetical protein BGX31_003032 [Mortierella sp. GBA43]
MVGQPQDMIVKNMGLHSLRQLRSKFHNLTTYTRSRFSGPLTAAFKVRPFTVFTVESFGNDWGATHANAILLQKIAEAVLLNGPSAVLSRDDVSEALSMAKNTKLAVKQQKTLEDIMRLFDNNETDIKIIGNRELNDSLEIIADCLSGRITEANVQVNLELQTLFRLRIAA